MKKMTLDDFQSHIYQNKILWMDLGGEKIWDKSIALIPHVNNDNEKYTISGMEQLCLLIAKQEDIVILKKTPEKMFLRHLEEAGIIIPKIIISSAKNNQSLTDSMLCEDEVYEYLNNLADKGKYALFPFSVTGKEILLGEKLNIELYCCTKNIISKINSKIFARTFAKKLNIPVTEGFICHTVEELESAYNNLTNENPLQKVVIKEPYGASGKGMFVVENDKIFSFLCRKLKRNSKKFNIIIETWYETSNDFNYQIYITKAGDIFWVAPKNQLLNSTMYVGSSGIGINSELSSYTYELIEKTAEKVAKELYKLGFWGLVSIDGIETSQHQIYPVIEFNGRFSLSTYYSFLADQVVSKKSYISVRYYDIKREVKLVEIYNALQPYIFKYKKRGVIILSFIEGRGMECRGRIFLAYVDYDDMIDYVERIIYRYIG